MALTITLLCTRLERKGNQTAPVGSDHRRRSNVLGMWPGQLQPRARLDSPASRSYASALKPASPTWSSKWCSWVFSCLNSWNVLAWLPVCQCKKAIHLWCAESGFCPLPFVMMANVLIIVVVCNQGRHLQSDWWSEAVLWWPLPWQAVQWHHERHPNCCSERFLQ